MFGSRRFLMYVICSSVVSVGKGTGVKGGDTVFISEFIIRGVSDGFGVNTFTSELAASLIEQLKNKNIKTESRIR
jgi:hypothetical protein